MNENIETTKACDADANDLSLAYGICVMRGAYRERPIANPDEDAMFLLSSFDCVFVIFIDFGEISFVACIHSNDSL